MNRQQAAFCALLRKDAGHAGTGGGACYGIGMLCLPFYPLVARCSRPARFAPALAAALLAGCSVGNYPTLEHRAAEQPAATSPAASPPPARDDYPPHLAASLDARMRQARAAFLRFASLKAEAQSAAAAASHAAPDSEAASRANLALANLESLRGETAQSLAELERLYSDDRIAHALEDAGPGPDRRARKAIEADRDEVLGIIAEEDQVLSGLQAQLPQ